MSRIDKVVFVTKLTALEIIKVSGGDYCECVGNNNSVLLLGDKVSRTDCKTWCCQYKHASFNERYGEFFRFSHELSSDDWENCTSTSQ